jgi:hypothetical protein
LIWWKLRLVVTTRRPGESKVGGYGKTQLQGDRNKELWCISPSRVTTDNKNVLCTKARKRILNVFTIKK